MLATPKIVKHPRAAIATYKPVCHPHCPVSGFSVSRWSAVGVAATVVSITCMLVCTIVMVVRDHRSASKKVALACHGVKWSFERLR